jgi:hypothetical protein
MHDLAPPALRSLSPLRNVRQRELQLTGGVIIASLLRFLPRSAHRRENGLIPQAIFEEPEDVCQILASGLRRRQPSLDDRLDVVAGGKLADGSGHTACAFLAVAVFSVIGQQRREETLQWFGRPAGGQHIGQFVAYPVNRFFEEQIRELPGQCLVGCEAGGPKIAGALKIPPISVPHFHQASSVFTSPDKPGGAAGAGLGTPSARPGNCRGHCLPSGWPEPRQKRMN